MISKLQLVTGFALAVILVQSVSAALINVDFNGSSVIGSDGVGATYSGAAVYGTAGDVWNGLNNSTTLPSTLLDSTGVSSLITLTMSNKGDQYNAGANSVFKSTSYNDLFAEYAFVAAGVNKTITLGNLAANSAFTLTLYSSTSAGGHVITNFTLDAANGGATAQSNFTAGSSPTAFTVGVNYVTLSGVADNSGSFTLTYQGAGTFEGSLAGFQLNATAVPEPTSLLMLGGSLMLGCLIHRRKSVLNSNL